MISESFISSLEAFERETTNEYHPIIVYLKACIWYAEGCYQEGSKYNTENIIANANHYSLSPMKIRQMWMQNAIKDRKTLQSTMENMKQHLTSLTTKYDKLVDLIHKDHFEKMNLVDVRKHYKSTISKNGNMSVLILGDNNLGKNTLLASLVRENSTSPTTPGEPNISENKLTVTGLSISNTPDFNTFITSNNAAEDLSFVDFKILVLDYTVPTQSVSF